MSANLSARRRRQEALNAHAGKYLTFGLNNEFFGIAIGKVQEIIGRMEIMPVPRLPRNVLGVINLRGQVIPVVSQRRAFGMEDNEANERECIIVVHIDVVDEEGEAERVMIGALVDTVSEVIQVSPEDLEPAPRIGSAVKSEFIVGMAKVRERVVTLLEIDKVYSSATLEYAIDTKDQSEEGKDEA